MFTKVYFRNDRICNKAILKRNYFFSPLLNLMNRIIELQKNKFLIKQLFPQHFDNYFWISYFLLCRLSSNDPSMLTNVKNVMNHLVQNYHSVFDDDHKCSSCDEDINKISNAVTSETCLRRQVWPQFSLLI